MNRRVFLDVGANTGQSLEAAMDPAFRFDRIYCFEPVASCLERLAKIADERVWIAPYGLWNKTCRQDVFEPGRKGAGLWKKDKGRSDETETCEFRRASDWFAENVVFGDEVYLKLNCEGAECDILDDLLDSGEFEKVSYVMIDFDVRKIASQKHREAEIRERLSAFTFPRWATSKQVMIGETHQDRIKNWLRLVESA